MIDHVNALVVPVRDVQRCAEFYRDKVGFTLDQLEAEEAYLTIGSPGGLVLALLSYGYASDMVGEERMKPDADSVKRTFPVVFVEDVDQSYAELTQKGVLFVDPPVTRPDGWRTAHFEDPEGNLWQIAQRPRKQTPA